MFGCEGQRLKRLDNRTGLLPPRDGEEKKSIIVQDEKLLIEIDGVKHEITMADALSLASNIIIQLEMKARFIE